MFTGLIEETGIIKNSRTISGGKSLQISAKKILNDVKIDDSIAVNGVCLTVVKIEDSSFWADAVGATLEKTTIGSLPQNDTVNLERSVKLDGRLGGHLVQGHVNGIGTITEIKKIGENYFLEVVIPAKLQKYVIEEGSICIDGISLTIANLAANRVGLSVIPHTWQNTNLNKKRIGDKINIETDVIAKYVEKLLFHGKQDENKFSSEWFKGMGYLNEQ